MNRIGIMQGRLSVAREGRFQFFPLDWEAEFSRAKELGFDQIEWFLDRDISGFDPIKDIWAKPEVLAKIDQARGIMVISSVDIGTYPMFGSEATLTLKRFLVFLSRLRHVYQLAPSLYPC